MARRVNKRFLIILTTVIVVGGISLIAAQRLLTKKDPTPFIQSAEALVAQGEYEEAVNHYLHAVSINPKDPELRVRLSDTLNQMSASDAVHFWRANAELDRALEIDPHYAPALERQLSNTYELIQMSGRADIPGWLERMNHPETGITSKVLAADPDHPRATAYRSISNIRAWMLGMGGDTRIMPGGEKPIVHPQIHQDMLVLMELAEQEPADPEVINAMALAYLHQASELIRLGQTAEASVMAGEAERIMNAAIQAQPDNGLLHYYAARVLASTPGVEASNQAVVDRIRELSRKARELTKPEEPHFIDAHLLAARSAQVENKPGDAERILRELIQTRPDAQQPRTELARLVSADPARLQEALDLLAEPAKAGPTMIGPRALTVEQRELERLVELTRMRIRDYQFAQARGEDVRPLLAKVEDGVTQVQLRARDAEENPSFLKLRGELYLLKNQPVEAVTSLSRAMNILTNQQMRDLELMHLLSRAYMMTQQTGQARAMLSEMVRLNPRYVPARAQLVELLIMENNLAEAMRHIDQLEEQAPDEPAVARLRLAAMNVTDSGQDARRYYTRLPENTREEKLSKARFAFRLNDIDDSQRLVEEALAARPDDLEAIQLLAQLHMHRDRTELALAVLEEGLKHHPNHNTLQMMRMQLQNAAPQEVRQFLLSNIEKIEDPFTRELRLAEFHMQAGDNERGLRHLREAERIKPSDPAVQDQLFNYHVARGELDQAQRYLDGLARGNADRAGGLTYRIRFALARGEVSNAVAQSRDLTQRMPEFAQSWLLLGHALQTAGQHEEALSSYSRALERQSNSVQALRGMIECAYALGRAEEARRFITQGRTVLPHHAYFIEQEHNYELSFGEPERILPPLQEAVRRNADDAQAVYALGRGYLQVARAKAGRSDERGFRENLQKARDTLAQGISRWPDEASFYSETADVAMVAGDARSAEQALQQLAGREAWKARPEPQLMLGKLFTVVGRNDDAEQAFRQAAELAGERRTGVEIELAAFLTGVGRFDDALAALQSEPNSPQVRRQKVAVLATAGRFPEAEREVRSLLSAEPHAIDLLNQLGLIQLRSGRPQEAVAQFNQVLAADSRNVTALYHRGVARLNLPQPNVDGSIQDLTAVRAQNPAHVDARVALADALQRKQDNAGAIRELNAALRISPVHKEARARLVNVYRNMRPPRWNDVERLLREAPNADNDLDWLHLQADMWLARRNHDRALEKIQAAMKLAPENPVLVQTYLNILMDAGRHAQVLRETDPVMEQIAGQPAAYPLHLIRGAAKRHLGDRDAAMEEFEAALEIATAAKSEQQALVVVGQIAEHIGAANALVIIEEKARADAKWWVLAARMYQTQSDWPNAVRTIELAKGDISRFPRAEQENVLRLAGTIYQLARPQPLVEKAHQAYLQLLDLNPQDLAALNNLACLLVDNMDPPRPDQALIYSERAYDIVRRSGQSDPLILDTHGWVLTLSGRVEEGITLLQQVVERSPFLEAHYHLGEAYLRRSIPDEAQRQLLLASEMIASKERENAEVDAKLKANVERALFQAREMLQSRSGEARVE
jgi:tetratricopeptide (TPR) repeat protein